MKTARQIEKQLDPHRSEKWLEQKFCIEAKSLGAIALKYSNGNETGYPDRLVILPNRMVIWVEFKSEGKHLTPVQAVRKVQLENMGHEVYIIDSTISLRAVLTIIEARMAQ